MTKKRKKLKPQLLLRMIVAGMSQPAMIFAAAVYAVARSTFGVSQKYQNFGLAQNLWNPVILLF